ncbi:MAG TPA: glycosyltransferase family 39 protein [Bacteroidia bacterium]|jgi:4-amino-4-deoxy-L-arabinose transferase-like glycosyltransferase|nr:glycosyltransferase family 39 protein [Bacteroidia bacterium]
MKLLLNNKYIALGFIILVSSVVFIPLIGNCPLFDWDEINFAECAREMVVTSNYSSVQLNYNPFWEKPPFFIWMQALSMNIFGINEFAARFPNAVCGILSLCVMFLIGRKVYSPAFGLTWVLIYLGTLLPHFYFKTGIIDPWFNLFIFSAFYQLLIHFNNPVGRSGMQSSLLAGFFLGIAVLTKGPAAIVIIGVFVSAFWGLKKFKNITTAKFIATFIGSLVITGCSWFLVELMRGNIAVIKAFFDYNIRLLNTEDSDHGGFRLYHFVVLLIGCFPTSLLMLLAFKKSANDTPYQKHIKFGMLILFFVVLGIFTIVNTKIVHYSSLCYFPIAFLATYSIFKLQSGEYKLKFLFGWAFIILSSVIGIVFILIGLIDKLKPFILENNLIGDEFAIENLKANVQWQGWEWAIGFSFILVSLFCFWQMKKGNIRSLYYLYGFYIVFIVTSINVFTPKIEQYSQDSAIEFYKAVGKKDFYVETAGFKSYAYLFYTNKKPEQNQNPDCIKYVNETLDKMEREGHNRLTSYALAYTNWMQYGNIDKPAVFVCKINTADGLIKNRLVKKLYQKNGFVFCVRMPGTN